MSPVPNAEEATAIAVAIARFEVDTAPAAAVEGEAASPWQKAALVEGVGAKGTVQRYLEGGFEWLS